MEKKLTEKQVKYMYPYTYEKYKKRLTYNGSESPRVPYAKVQDFMKLKDGERIKVIFESVNSDWRQGIHLKIDKQFEVKGRIFKKDIGLWYDTAPKEVIITCYTKDGKLWIWNIWDHIGKKGETRSIMSEMNFCGMLIEELPNGRRYRCNEGRDDDDYDDLIFRIERVAE